MLWLSVDEFFVFFIIKFSRGTKSWTLWLFAGRSLINKCKRTQNVLQFQGYCMIQGGDDGKSRNDAGGAHEFCTINTSFIWLVSGDNSGFPSPLSFFSKPGCFYTFILSMLIHWLISNQKQVSTQKEKRKCYFFLIFFFPWWGATALQLHSGSLSNQTILRECQIQPDLDDAGNSTATFTTQLFPGLCGFKGTITFLEDLYYTKMTQSQSHSVIQGACLWSPKQPEGFLTSGCFLLLAGRHRLVIHTQHMLKGAVNGGTG